MFGRYKDERYDCSYVSRFVSLNKKINFYYDWIGKNITTFTVDEVKSFVDKIVYGMSLDFQIIILI